MYMGVKKMNSIEILKNYINEHNGILLTSDLKKLNIHRQYIKILCDENFIERLEKGVYAKKDQFVNDFFLMQQRYKSGIYSHNTALFFYHLTDRAPLKYDMTFKNNIRVNEPLISPSYVKEEYYDIGLIEMPIYDGTTIRIYNLERTIIDIIRDRNKIDIQIFSDALKGYMERKDQNFLLLGRYAKLFKVKEILQTFMKVL